MSLRLRLILGILAVVALMGIANFLSFNINRRTQRQVAQLSRMSMVERDRQSLVGQAFEIKGYWDRKGFFVATDIEKLSQSRRPKIRGKVQEIDPENRRLKIYGRWIRANDETEYPYAQRGIEPFGRLRPGQRVEVSCKVDEEGVWIARKIETRGVKKSDKVKGVITKAKMNQGLQHTLEIHGLPIRVDRGTAMRNPRSPLYRMENATQMTLAIRMCMATAHELLKERYREKDLLQAGKVEEALVVRNRIEDLEDRLAQGAKDFTYYLSESRSAVEGALRSASAEGSRELARAEREKIALWLRPLDERGPVFRENVSQFLELSAADLNKAQEFLQNVLEPHLRDDILPLAQAFHLESEEELSEELQEISSRSETVAHIAVATNITGLILALALGFTVSRSISKPILALKTAAREVGEGNFETRIDIHSKDELGVLASAFNRMAEELAATTVSVANLKNVIDSMAGALFILMPDGQIKSVNPAALALLGYEEGELVGRPFEVICPKQRDGEEDGHLQPTDDGIVAAEERVFHRKDGAAVPVSFSGAALRDEKGSIRGFVCVAQDLTERKLMEEELRRSLSQKEILLREVHHRVKNNLQVISSLLDLQSRTITEPESLDKFKESQDRIRSMVFIHEQLYHTSDFKRIDFRTYMELLAQHLLQSYGVVPEKICLRLNVEDLHLDLDRALACGLIVNELVTNAFKHAYPGDAFGEIVISSRLAETGDFVLEVSDNGRGFNTDFDPERAESLGLSLVRTLVKQLRGRFQVDCRDTVIFHVEFPLEPPGEII